MDLFAILLGIAMLCGNASADCAAIKKACQDVCCEDPAGVGPNINKCDDTQVVCKCFTAKPTNFQPHKDLFKEACKTQGNLGMRFNQVRKIIRITNKNVYGAGESKRFAETSWQRNLVDQDPFYSVFES